MPTFSFAEQIKIMSQRTFLGVAVLLFVFGFTTDVVNAYVLQDDFEGYATGDLETVTDNLYEDNNSGNDIQVVNSFAQSGSQSLHVVGSSPSIQSFYPTDVGTFNSGVVDMYVYYQSGDDNGGTQYGISMRNDSIGGIGTPHFEIEHSGNVELHGQGGGTCTGMFTSTGWYHVIFTSSIDSEGNYNHLVTVEGVGSCSGSGQYGSWSEFDEVLISIGDADDDYDNTEEFYVDNLSIWTDEDIPPPSEIVGGTFSQMAFSVPTEDETVASGAVDFTLDYYWLPTGQVIEAPDICFEIVNYSTMSSVNVPAVPDCITNAEALEIDTISFQHGGFTDGDLYGIRAYWWDTESGTSVEVDGQAYSPWRRFAVGSYPEGGWNSWGGFGTTSTSTIGDLTVQCDPDDPFWENSICNAAVFLFIPGISDFDYYHRTIEAIPEKFPFSYFYAVVSSVQGIDDLSETATSSSFTLDMTDTAFAQSYEILSPNTVDKFLSEEMRNVFRTAMAYALWLTFGVMVFMRVRRIFG